MKLKIGGMGWVTPLGSGVASVCERIANGEQPTGERITSPMSERAFTVFRVPPEATANAPVHPRLRRASAISRFAVVAGLAALEDAQIKLDSESATRTALIFAVSNGGVVYTKRFYHDIVASGAQAASPLLFPETVFNAPASHLAAILGIVGATYTLVGDGAVGVLALQMAQDLMQNESLDRCLVVGAEEADWLLCDAFWRWCLLRQEPPIRVFEQKPRGTILSEGAGAILLTRSGSPSLDQVAGENFGRQRDAARSVQNVFTKLQATDRDVIVASANGTFVDQAEAAAIAHRCPHAQIFAPKTGFGESPGSGAIWQTIFAAQILRTSPPPSRRALVSACGMNQQVAGLLLSLGD